MGLTINKNFLMVSVGKSMVAKILKTEKRMKPMPVVFQSPTFHNEIPFVLLIKFKRFRMPNLQVNILLSYIKL